VLGGAARLVVVGAAAGLLLALLAGRLLNATLFGVASTDPATVLVAMTIVLPLILFAAAVPAYRASRIDPLVALRSE
jgi:ABC-type antimicrobial peptide transport system permease subunit